MTLKKLEAKGYKITTEKGGYVAQRGPFFFSGKTIKELSEKITKGKSLKVAKGKKVKVEKGYVIAFPTNNGNHNYVNGSERGTNSAGTAIVFPSKKEANSYISKNKVTKESWIEDLEGNIK